MGRTDNNTLGRVFIVSDSDYPGLDATSNYIRNFAKALSLAEVDTRIVSVDRSADGYNRAEWTSQVANISYISVAYPVVNKVTTFISRYSYAARVWKELKEVGINPSDRVIVYSQKYAIVNAIVDKCRRNDIKVSAIVVEWFEGRDKNQNKCFGKAYPKCNSVIAISKNIKNYFESLGLKTIILPPMVDIGSEAYVANKTEAGKVKFLYTGRFVGKDDMQVMLKAIALLPEAVKSNLEFHITRYNDDALIKASGIDETTWQAIKEVIVTHGDVSHEKLQQLLDEADYLPIARQNNRTTISNFPSKIPEAMALGIVPVMTRVGDCPNDYLTDGVDSILFEECTPECCARAFERAIDIAESSDRSRFKSLKSEAYNTASKRFAVANYSKILVDFVL